MRCLCCGGETRAFLEATEPNYEFDAVALTYIKCSTCQTVQKTPQPDEKKLRAYYETFWQFSEPRPKPCWDSAAQWVSRAIKSPVLNGIDVGGKDLSIFTALREAGVRVEKQSVLDAQPKAGEATPAWLGQGYTSQHQYDLVVATHVLEHTIEPRTFLRDVRLMMCGGAWLYLEVPSLELGSSDLTSADDICPSHLWHFTLSGLTTLLHSCGFLVLKAEADGSVKGWPCNRILAKARAWELEPFKDLFDSTRAIYEMATQRITEDYKIGDALYGASNSCWRLHEHDRFLRGTVKSMQIYDLYKTGMFFGRFIRNPDRMKADGVRRLWLTPRFWNSRIEVGGWLAENYPSIEVLSPYRGGSVSGVTK